MRPSRLIMHQWQVQVRKRSNWKSEGALKAERCHSGSGNLTQVRVSFSTGSRSTCPDLLQILR